MGSAEIRAQIELIKASQATNDNEYEDVLEQLRLLELRRQELYRQKQVLAADLRRKLIDLQEALLKEQNDINLSAIEPYVSALKSHRRHSDILPFQHEDLAFMFDRWSRHVGLLVPTNVAGKR